METKKYTGAIIGGAVIGLAFVTYLILALSNVQGRLATIEGVLNDPNAGLIIQQTRVNDFLSYSFQDQIKAYIAAVQANQKK